MVTIRYKGIKSSFRRTDGGGVVAFHPNQVYEFNEDDKRGREFVQKILAKPDTFEVLPKVGAKKVGAGVRTGSKASRNKTQKKVDKALKKSKGLKKGKGKAK